MDLPYVPSLKNKGNLQVLAERLDGIGSTCQFTARNRMSVSATACRETYQPSFEGEMDLSCNPEVT